MGIDQSYTCTGYAVLDVVTDTTTVLTFGTICTTKEDGDIYTRARIIVDKLKEIVDNNKVEKISIEGLAFGGLGNATRDLAGLQFMIIDAFRPLMLEIIAPTAVKKIALGQTKGKIVKHDLFNALPPLTQKCFLDFGLKKTKGLYDVVDSYWIGKSIKLTDLT